MSMISQPSQQPISTPYASKTDEAATQLLLGENNKAPSTAANSQKVPVKDVIDVSTPRTQDKPSLKMPEKLVTDSSVLFDVTGMSKAELEEPLSMVSGMSASMSNIQGHMAATTPRIENVIREIITEENGQLEKMFPSIAKLDESEIKQLSQGVNLMMAASAIKDVQVAQANHEDVKPGIQSFDAIKDSQFIGIISNDILVELRNLLTQIKSIINTADRQLQADFLKLKTQMVQSAADTTIKEGEKPFLVRYWVLPFQWGLLCWVRHYRRNS